MREENGSLPVKGPSGLVISPSWSDIFSLGVDYTLAEAGVVPFCDTPYYTGCNADGTSGSSCSDWSSVAGFSELGDANSNENFALGGNAGNCSVARPVVCVCVGGMF